MSAAFPANIEKSRRIPKNKYKQNWVKPKWHHARQKKKVSQVQSHSSMSAIDILKHVKLPRGLLCKPGILFVEHRSGNNFSATSLVRLIRVFHQQQVTVQNETPGLSRMKKVQFVRMRMNRSCLSGLKTEKASAQHQTQQTKTINQPPSNSWSDWNSLALREDFWNSECRQSKQTKPNQQEAQPPLQQKNGSPPPKTRRLDWKIRHGARSKHEPSG